MKCWFGLSLFGVLSGCGKQMTQSDLVGNYVADYSAAKEQLTLLSDGQFIQQVIIKATSQILATNGTWTFDAADKRVTFRDDLFNILDGFGQPKKQPASGIAMLPVIRRFGHIQIGDAPTVKYKKQPNS